MGRGSTPIFLPLYTKKLFINNIMYKKEVYYMDFNYNNTTISSSGGLKPIQADTPLDIRTVLIVIATYL